MRNIMTELSKTATKSSTEIETNSTDSNWMSQWEYIYIYFINNRRKKCRKFLNKFQRYCKQKLSLSIKQWKSWGRESRQKAVQFGKKNFSRFSHMHTFFLVVVFAASSLLMFLNLFMLCTFRGVFRARSLFLSHCFNVFFIANTKRASVCGYFFYLYNIRMYFFLAFSLSLSVGAVKYVIKFAHSHNNNVIHKFFPINNLSLSHTFSDWHVHEHGTHRIQIYHALQYMRMSRIYAKHRQRHTIEVRVPWHRCLYKYQLSLLCWMWVCMCGKHFVFRLFCRKRS